MTVFILTPRLPAAEDDVRTTSRIPREPNRYAHFLRADAHLCRRRVEARERACELRVHKGVCGRPRPRELGPGPPKATRRGGRRVAGLV